MPHFHQQCIHSGKRKIFTAISPSHYRILLSTVMFILSTTHVALSIAELLQLEGFVFERESTPGGAEFYRINVFPKRKAIYIVNVCPFLFFSWLQCAVCLFPGVMCLFNCQFGGLSACCGGVHFFFHSPQLDQLLVTTCSSNGSCRYGTPGPAPPWHKLVSFPMLITYLVYNKF